MMKFAHLARMAAVAGALALSASSAGAQDTPNTPNRTMNRENLSSGLTPERKREIEEVARTITESAQNSRDTAVGRNFAEAGANVARRVDDIADAALATDRDKVLKFLGIDPEGESSLYYFVSYEMPIDLLRSYVVEAMWSGGTLVFRGIPPGREMRDFITKDLRELIYGKGSSASISLDPRLFDGYAITQVPTIVYTEDRKNFQCKGVNPQAFTYEKKKLSYDTCPPVDESKYWKITGAVTTDFALREFIKAGATRAQVNLDALAKGFSTGTVAPKNQQAFSGEWKEALSPEELMSVQSAIETARGPGSKIPEALKPKTPGALKPQSP